MKISILPMVGLLVLVSLTLTGCGGGSNGGGSSSGVNGQALTGDLSAQATLISSYQAFQGGVNYPFAQVQATLPTGSTFRTALRAAVAAALQKRAAAHGQTAHTGPAADGIGLYSAASLSGNTGTLTFYTDAAETQSVGTLTITQTAPVTTSLNLGTYTTYPVAFTIAANVTSGPLPVTGSGNISLTDSAGAGTITGTFTLPATHVSAAANLTLSDSGNVGGTATVNENGQTLTLTNLSGTLSGPITGNVAVAPSGDTGTATLNIANGTFAVTLNTPTGTATGTSNSSGGLDITLPSGASETISSPLTASPTAPITSGTSGGGGGTTTGGGGGTTTGGGTTFTAGVSVGTARGYNVTRVDFDGGSINDSGQIAGSNEFTGATYDSSPSSVPITLQGPATTDDRDRTVITINHNGQMISAGLYWASSTAVPTVLAPLPGGISVTGTLAKSMNNSRQIVGNAEDSSNNHVAVYWSNPAATPQVLAVPAGVAGVSAAAINNNGAIVGSGTVAATTQPMFSSTRTVALYWSSPSSTATELLPVYSDPATSQVEESDAAMSINDDNMIVGTSNTATYDGPSDVATVWTSPTATPVVLPSSQAADFVNNAGQILGAGSNGGPALWVNQQYEDLSATFSGDALEIRTDINGNVEAGINASGQIFLRGGSASDTYILTPQ